jgi:transcriptional regulator with PAS, ATPase and Fis domain
MTAPDWIQEFPASITVCDRDGVLLEMNDRAAETFAQDGGRYLIGRNLLDCHPEPARSKTQRLLESGTMNAYTIEKQGVKKLIYPAPWYRDGKYSGLVELSIELPPDLPHFVRS